LAGILRQWRAAWTGAGDVAVDPALDAGSALQDVAATNVSEASERTAIPVETGRVLMIVA
jgi:hypothetical protein